MTRIIAYGDESGLDEKAEYFLMGGILGTPLDWQTARSEWQQVLCQFKVRKFHSNDFFGGKGQYRDWGGSQRDSLLDSLLSVLCSSIVTPIGCAIHIGDFLGLSTEERRILSGAYNKTRLTLRRRDTSQPFEARIERKLEGPDAEKQVYRVGSNTSWARWPPSRRPTVVLRLFWIDMKRWRQAPVSTSRREEGDTHIPTARPYRV